MKYVKIFITLFFVMSTACVQGMIRSPVSSLPLQRLRPTGSSVPKSFTAEQLTAGVTVQDVMNVVISICDCASCFDCSDCAIAA